MKKLLSVSILLLVCSGCVYTSIPTLDGRRARTIRIAPWTKMEATEMTWANGKTNVHIRLNGYEGRIDSDAIDSTGEAVGKAGGTAIRKAVSP